MRDLEVDRQPGSDLDADAIKAANKMPRRNSKKKKKKKRKVSSHREEREEDKEEETYSPNPLPPSKTSSSMFGGLLPLDAINALIDYESVATKGGSPSPGVVVSSWSALAVSSWSAPSLLGQHSLRTCSPQEHPGILLSGGQGRDPSQPHRLLH